MTPSFPIPRVALGLEPRQVLLPRDEVVHLLDLDVPEPGELVGELAMRLLGRRRPDLRQHGRLIAAAFERGAEPPLGAVHRGRVEAADTGGERGLDDGACEPSVVPKGVPRAETDDGSEATLLHATIIRACARTERRGRDGLAVPPRRARLERCCSALAGQPSGRAGESADETTRGDAGCVGGTEEGRILVGASAHVGEREPGACLLPPFAVRDVRHGDVRERQLEHRLGVV